MPEYIRALIVILVVGTATFYIFRPGFTAGTMSSAAFDLRRTAWYLITLAAFLSLNYWVFLLILILIINKIKKSEDNKIALFFFLMLTLPQIKAEVPGFAGIRYLLQADYLRTVTLLLLLPICYQGFKNRRSEKSNFKLPDALIFGYYFLEFSLHFQPNDLVGGIRNLINTSIDIFIPYYAISRGVKTMKELKEIMASFALAGLMVAAIAIFEFSKRWLLYGSLAQALDLGWTPGYLVRGDYIRAVATSGHSLVLGYVLVAAIGAYIYVKGDFPNKFRYWLGLGVLLMGEIATLAKGSWLGLLVLLTVFVVTGVGRVKKISNAILICALSAVILFGTDVGDKIVPYLPFLGQLDTGSFEYRRLVFEKSIALIEQSPWLGVENSVNKLEDLRQGEGIIDIVNIYIVVALSSGVIGLSLFVSYFLVVLQRIYQAYALITRKGTNNDNIKLGQILLAILLGALFIISTVSPIFHVPIIYVIFSSLGLAYHSMITGSKKLS